MFEAQTLYLVNVKVFRGRNATDEKLFGVEGCVMQVQCLDKTYVIQDTQVSEWNRSMQFYFYYNPKSITFKVFHHDTFKGIHTFNLHEYFDSDSAGTTNLRYVH